MKASVIIPIRVDHPEFDIYLKNLACSLAAASRQKLAAASRQDVEKILVDYGSTVPYSIKIRILAHKYGFRYVRCEGEVWSRARALNAGIQEATGDYVFFVDADCVIPPHYVSEHLKVLGEKMATYSPVFDTTKEIVKTSDYSKLIAQHNAVNRQSDQEATRNDQGVRAYGHSHMGIYRQWLLDHGGFKEGFSGWGREDDDLHNRLNNSGVKRSVVKALPVHLWHLSYRTLMNRVGKGRLLDKLINRNNAILCGAKMKTVKEARYGMISISSGSVNGGNKLIEHSLLKLLNLPDPAVSVSMFKDPTPEQVEKLNSCAFVLLPGSTILARGRGQSEALSCLSQLKAPVFCVGASSWGPEFQPYTEILRHITPPIGCRDPHILKVCMDEGVEATFTGCPTAYYPRLEPTLPDVPFSIVGFARTHHNWQYALFQSLGGKLTASVQEPGIEQGFSQSITPHSFDYSNPESVMHHYSQAKAVYTGRLHSILPAMSQGKPVCFFGQADDTRFTLLSYLNIPIMPFSSDPTDRTMTFWGEYKSGLDELRSNFYAWADKTIHLVYERE